MVKYIICLLTAAVFSGAAYAQEPVIRFAYRVQKGSNVFMLDDAIRGNYEVVIDETTDFRDKPADYLQSLAKAYLQQNPEGVKSNGSTSYVMVTEEKKYLSNLSKYKFGKPLYISTAAGVFNAPVSSYYVNCCDDFMAGTFYPVLDTKDNLPVSVEGADKSLFIVSDKPGIGKMSFDEEKDMSKRHGVFTALDKLYNVSITKGEETQEEIKIFSGSFTEKGKKEYLASYRNRPDFENYVSGVFILDEEFNKTGEVFPMSEKNFYYNKPAAIVDVNGDGIDEIVIENGYYEGSGYELWGYKNGKFELITSGFFFGV